MVAVRVCFGCKHEGKGTGRSELLTSKVRQRPGPGGGGGAGGGSEVVNAIDTTDR